MAPNGYLLVSSDYEFNTGCGGFLTLWVGLFVQVSTIVLLAGLSETSAQPVGVAIAAYFISVAIYLPIDVAWVFVVEMRVFNYFFDRNNYERPTLTRPFLLPTFFLFAAAALTLVVILPGLDERSEEKMLERVALRGFTLGWFAYGNLTLVQAWSYKRYPLELLGISPLSGGVLCMLSSLFTTLICDWILDQL